MQSVTPFSIASTRLRGHIWRKYRLLHPMGRPTRDWWPRRVQRPALCGDGVAGATASLVVLWGAESLLLFSLLATVRSVDCSGTRRRPVGLAAHTSDAPSSIVACEPRNASRFSRESVGQRCERASASEREDGESERSSTSPTSSHNFHLGMHSR